MSDGIRTEEEMDGSASKKEEGFVSKKAYEEVATDMHKFKSKVKEAEARANELEAQLKAMEIQKMQEQEQWKELYEKRTEELETVLSTQREKEERYINAAKKNALKQELGGIRDEYLVHANISAITLNEDGTVNRESVHAAANEFREKHAILLGNPAATSSTNPPAAKEPDLKTLTKDELNEKLKNMSFQEKVEFMKSLSNS